MIFYYSGFKFKIKSALNKAYLRNKFQKNLKLKLSNYMVKFRTFLFLIILDIIKFEKELCKNRDIQFLLDH
jgi:hypothetical protein